MRGGSSGGNAQGGEESSSPHTAPVCLWPARTQTAPVWRPASAGCSGRTADVEPRLSTLGPIGADCVNSVAPSRAAPGRTVSCGTVPGDVGTGPGRCYAVM